MKETGLKRKSVLSLTKPLAEIQRQSSSRVEHSTDNRKARGSIPLSGTRKEEQKMNVTLTPTLEINDKYIPDIRTGKKQSTIRRGVRAYPKGECILRGKREQVRVKIHRIGHNFFKDLMPVEAKADGFDSLDTLWQELTTYYPNLKKDEHLTIVRFSYVSG